MSEQATLQLVAVIGALALVLLNGFFVAAEFALVKVRATRMRELAATGNWRAKITSSLIDHLDAYLSATQLGITLASLGLGWIGEPAIARLIEPLLVEMDVTSPTVVHGVSFAVAFGTISFLHIVIGELAPKSLAIRKSEATSLWVAVPLRLFYYLMYPAIVVLNGAANALLRVFGIAPVSETDEAHSSEELRMIVSASHVHGELNATERRLFENVIDFSERRIDEIMVPRLDMVCLFADRDLESNLDVIHKHQHTRYPLAVQSKDQIIGIIHVKDLLEAARRQEKDFDLTRVKRDVNFVPETVAIDQMLRTFQTTRNHMAVVVDEYGGVAGMVTLDDVLEELVGPILDEFDVVETPIVRRGEDVLVDGATSLDDVAEALEFDLPVGLDVNSIGGYVAYRLARLPEAGDAVELGPYRVEVMRMDGTRVAKLRLRRTPEPTEEAGESGAG